MKGLKRIMALALAIVMALAIVINVRGAYVDTYYYDGPDAGFAQSVPSFDSVTGEVISFCEYFDNQVRLAVGESFVDFNITANTFIHGDFPQVGDIITGFFNNNMPMIMIYPPQYTAAVIINQEDGPQSVFMDRFHAIEDSEDGLMISADGKRVLNATNPDTVIVSQDGVDASDWDLEGRLLVVFYTLASRSMPPVIFAPEKIVVMYEIAVHPGPAYIGDMMDNLLEWEYGYDGQTPFDGNEYVGIVPIWDDFHDIVINGVGLPGETFYSIDGENATHVPIRAIAGAFGMIVGWERPYVTLTGDWGNIRFRTNTNQVTVNGETITLSLPNVVVDGRTQVPIDFFRLAAGLNAWSSGGTVFIDNEEPMQ